MPQPPDDRLPPDARIRREMDPRALSRDEFLERFRARFQDPAYGRVEDALSKVADVAWEAYRDDRKSPNVRRAGPGFADPDQDLPVEWLEARRRIHEAEARRADPAGPSRVLVVNASSRTEHTCPGETSKTWRLARLAVETIESEAGFETDVLDLSRLTSEYGRVIHPCKACVSTSMPLCHWPCSCYPNHGMGQTGDWMNEIYERFAAAHGVLLAAPVNWYQAPSGLKLMIDRLVCADGGNPDPTTTNGKDPERAKALELAGWPYPKHLAGRAFAVVVHGDVAGAEQAAHALRDWLEWMGLHDATTLARYVGYYEPYATSHAALDRDDAFREEVRNAARSLVALVRRIRGGTFVPPDAGLRDPRPK
jgi:multimeric flavodoxin WrbA